MGRLTAQRMNGIKSGYWSLAKKDELIQRLGEYEDMGLEPDQLRMLIKACTTPEMIKEVKGCRS